MRKIRIAIVGVGNCASSLVQGINFYRGTGANGTGVGLMHREIGSYRPGDIEVVAAMAPKASQIVYEGPNTTQGVNDTYNQIVTDNKAQVMTVSWGECESQSGNAELQTLDNIFKQGASQGISMYAASGDSGAYDCNDTNLAVDSPAGDPYITGVGGTNLQLNNGAYGSESVWSNPADTQRSPQGAGGGGGISRPSAARVQRKVPVSVMSSTVDHCSSVISTRGTVPPSPALCTATSKRPW